VKEEDNMKKSKRLISSLITIILVGVTLIGCGSKANNTATSTNSTKTETTEDTGKDKVYKIGVSQLVEHVALDASYKGFIDGLSR